MGVTGFFGGFNLHTQVYSPENDSWSLRAPPPHNTLPGAAGVTSGVWAPKRIYVICDDRDTLIYDPAGDKWIGGNSAPTSPGEFGIVFIKDKLYLIGSHTVFHFYDKPSYVSKYAKNLMYTPSEGTGTIPPVVSVLSPKNNVTYMANNVSLVFTVNQEANWSSYSLDGQENVTIIENPDLSRLSNGLDSIRVYAKDEFGNIGASETVAFTVASESLPTATVAACCRCRSSSLGGCWFVGLPQEAQAQFSCCLAGLLLDFL